MFRIEHILTDQEARDLRDKINVHLGEEAPVEPPVTDPVDPPVVDPVDPPKPPAINPALVNRTFAQIWGTNLRMPSQQRAIAGQLKKIKVPAGGILSVAIPLPKITHDVVLSFAKASSLPHGIRHAVLSWDQSFDNPLAAVDWGTTALRDTFTKVEGERTAFLNVKLDDPTVAWDLFVQPSLAMAK